MNIDNWQWFQLRCCSVAVNVLSEKSANIDKKRQFLVYAHIKTLPVFLRTLTVDIKIIYNVLLYVNCGFNKICATCVVTINASCMFSTRPIYSLKKALIWFWLVSVHWFFDTFWIIYRFLVSNVLKFIGGAVASYTDVFRGSSRVPAPRRVTNP